MHTFLSYISEKSLVSDEFSTAENAAKDLLTLFSSKEARLKFYDKFLGVNKLKQASLGQFHTPEMVTNVVLDCLPEGFEHSLLAGATLLDPSCGTGNFLIEVVRRVQDVLISSGVENPSKIINEKVIPNIYGFEIDPIVVEAAKKIFNFEFNGEVNFPTVIISDSLVRESESLKNYLGFFDFVVGNPPWVEVKNLEDEIKDYVQKNYSVSNLYGAFILRGRDFLKSSGYLSYVVPRSFTGGKYYSSLRKVLRNETTINKISYYRNRNQKFHGGNVLQEMVVISFKNDPPKSAIVKCIPCSNFDDFKSENGFEISQKDLFSQHDLIMILSDSHEDFSKIKKISSFKNFEELGFRFSTGQLVTHRSLAFLRTTQEEGSFRIIYPNDILNQDYKFSFSLKPNIQNDKPYAVLRGVPNRDGRMKDSAIEGKESSIEKYCNTFDEIILCRRRSHKGDKRRFVGVYLSDEISRGYFIDNGLNFIVKQDVIDGSPSLKALSRLLRSDLFEYFFESVSSNTQINKNDMYLFGIPTVTEHNADLYTRLENTDFNDVFLISEIVEKIYEVALEN